MPCTVLVFISFRGQKVLMSGLLNSLYGQLVFSNFRGSGQAVQIVKRHHFASYLKRMSVVVRVQEEFLAFVKVSWLLFFLCMLFN